jgi:hypothetical protein
VEKLSFVCLDANINHYIECIHLLKQILHHQSFLNYKGKKIHNILFFFFIFLLRLFY